MLSLSVLAGELLQRGDLGPAALETLVAYLAAESSNRDVPPTFTANLARLRTLIRPRAGTTDNLEVAREWNEAVSVACPALAWPHVHLGVIGAARGDLDAAIRELESACERDPADVQANALLAYVLSTRGRGEAAVHLDRTAAPRGDRGVLLLRAHTLRRIGEPRAAAEAYRRADALRALESDALLAYAETLVNSDQIEAARSVLERMPSRDSSRWMLLAAASSDRPDRALDLLARVFADPELAPQAVSQVLARLERDPSIRGGGAILDVVPAALRSDGYWPVRRRVLQAPDDRLTPLVLLHFRRLYNAGLYREVLLAATERHASAADPARLRTIVTPALIRFIQTTMAEDPRQAPAALALVEDVQSRAPSLVAGRDVQLVRGLLLAVEGHPRAACEALEAAYCAGAEETEGRLQLARCALVTGEVARSADVLRVLDPTDRRVARVAAAHAAIAGDWKAALRHVEVSAPLDIDSPQLAALWFQTGRDVDIGERAEREPSCAYFAAVTAARAGDRERADRLCRTVPPDHALREGADRLAGWLRLQEACDCLSAGNQTAAIHQMIEAARLWRDESGPTTQLAHWRARLLLLPVAADQRSQMLAALRQLDDEVGGLSVAGCHRLALYYLSEGERCAAANWPLAFEHFEQAIAHLCVPLADPEYLRSWTRQRGSIYGAAVETASQSLPTCVVEVVHDVLSRCEARLRLTGATDLADRMSTLSLSFRAELRGAQLVRDAGGFTNAPGCDRPVAVGPTYLGLMGWERAFASFLDDADDGSAGGHDDSDEARWATLLAGAFSTKSPRIRIGQETRVSIERLYSALRFAAVLEADEQLEQALSYLRAQPWRCLPIGQNRVCDVQSGDLCDERSAQFVRCNPAFACDGGGARLRAVARDMRVSLLLRLGERQIALTPDRIDQGVAYWRDALDDDEEHRARTSTRIREVARGRARVLDANAREAEAIRLLEGVDDLIHDVEIQGELALLYMHLGIRTVNATRNWQEGVECLRKARRLNPSSSQIDLNLAIALCRWASEIQFDVAAANALLTEAFDITQANLTLDPNNTGFQELVLRVREGRESIRLRGGRPAASSSGSSAARLSAMYCESGRTRARAGELDEAVADLEKAIDLDPSNDAARTTLAAVMLEKLMASARERR